MKITYWSDYACPFCYIGETRMRKAIEQLGAKEPIEIEMHAFELDPEAPREATGSIVEHLAKKYGISHEEAQSNVDGISQAGRGEGIDFKFETVIATNTLDAHRLTKLAHSQGISGLEELYYKANFVDNEMLSDHEVLKKHALEAGLDEADVDRVLASDEFEDEVRLDEQRAYAQGVNAVPFFVIDNKYALAGCYPTNDMVNVLREVLNKESASEPTEKTNQGANCGAGGCALD